MRTLITGLALALFAGAAFAQVPGLHNAEVENRVSMNDPAKAVSKTGTGWIAMEIPVVAGTHAPCCWKGRWNSQREIGCSLEKDFNSYGSTSESPLAKTVIIYARAEKGDIDRFRMTGAQCPMDAAGQTVSWIGETDDDDTLDWLESLSGSDSEPVSNSALWALALHASSDAFRRLAEMVRNSHDPEQRSMAMFWLAQERPQEARDLLLEVAETERDEEMLDQAVFAISQLPSDVSGPLLLDLARDETAPRHARRQALFWLAQTGDDETVMLLTEMLTR